MQAVVYDAFKKGNQTKKICNFGADLKSVSSMNVIDFRFVE